MPFGFSALADEKLFDAAADLVVECIHHTALMEESTGLSFVILGKVCTAPARGTGAWNRRVEPARGTRRVAPGV